MKILSKAPLSTYCFIERYIAELDLIKSANQVVGSKQSKERRWIPPSEGVVKINVDVVLSKNTGKAAAAVIARDGVGVFIDASVLVVEGSQILRRWKHWLVEKGSRFLTTFCCKRYTWLATMSMS